MKIKPSILILLFMMLTSSSAFAVEEIMKHYRNSRTLAMGGVYTTTGLYDQALFGNPALHLEPEFWKVSIIDMNIGANLNMINDYSKVNQVRGTSGSSVLTKIADMHLVGRNENTRFSNVSGFYSPNLFGAYTAFAAGLLASSQTNLMLRGHADIETQLMIEVGPGVGVAQGFFDGDLSVGMNLRSLYRVAGRKTFTASEFIGGEQLKLSSIAGQGIGIDLDLGVYYKIPYDLKFVRASFGVTGSDIAASTYGLAARRLLKALSGSPTRNARTFSGGFRFDFSDYWLFSGNIFAFEFQDIGKVSVMASTWKRFHLGWESHLTKFIALRWGFNQGYPGGGIGVDLPVFKLDLTTYGEEIGTNTGQLEDRRVVARIALEI